MMKLLKTKGLLLILLAKLQFCYPISSQTSDKVLLKAINGLKFDQVRIKVAPGSSLTIVLKNDSEMPHNLILGKPRSRLKIVKASNELGFEGSINDYVPQIDEIIDYIGVIDPGERDSITIDFPNDEGIYPYVCTLPGHGSVMFGAIYVTDKELPELISDPNVPAYIARDFQDMSKNEGHDEMKHPYDLIPPFYYRTYVPGSSPAAIICCLPGSINFCWDAGTCKLRFGWIGDLDQTNIWAGHFDAYADIIGDLFFKDEKSDFPLRTDFPFNILPVVEFRGYKILNSGYLEFHYLINGIDVRETISDSPDFRGLIRRFKFSSNSTGRSIYFIANDYDNIDYYDRNNVLINRFVKLDESNEILIFMKIKKEYDE